MSRLVVSLQMQSSVFLVVTGLLLMQARWLYGGNKNSFFFQFFLSRADREALDNGVCS